MNSKKSLRKTEGVQPGLPSATLLGDGETCLQCQNEGQRRYYPNEYDTLTQLYCPKCKRGFGALEIA